VGASLGPRLTEAGGPVIEIAGQGAQGCGFSPVEGAEVLKRQESPRDSPGRRPRETSPTYTTTGRAGDACTGQV